jgi:hypothetical protein
MRLQDERWDSDPFELARRGGGVTLLDVSRTAKEFSYVPEA